MNRAKTTIPWLVSGGANSLPRLRFTGLPTTTPLVNGPFHSMLVVQPDSNRQELGWFTYAPKPVAVRVKDAWRAWDDEEKDSD